MKTRIANQNTRIIIPIRQSKSYTYPNAATNRYYLEKALDYLLAAVTSIGTVTALVFFITL